MVSFVFLLQILETDTELPIDAVGGRIPPTQLRVSSGDGESIRKIW